MFGVVNCKIMDAISKLTPREYEIAELLAWGASKKEVADHLFIAVRTVENHTRNIFGKLECNSVNELSAMWFCDKYQISMSLSPRKCKLMTILLFIILIPQIVDNSDNMVRVFRTKTAQNQTCRVSRRRDNECAIFCFDLV